MTGDLRLGTNNFREMTQQRIANHCKGDNRQFVKKGLASMNGRISGQPVVVTLLPARVTG